MYFQGNESPRSWAFFCWDTSAFSCNSVSGLYLPRSRAVAEGITARKKNHSVTTTTVQKESEDGLAVGLPVFCALVFFGLGPRLRTITCQIRSLATVEICIVGSLVGMDGFRLPGEFWEKRKNWLWCTGGHVLSSTCVVLFLPVWWHWLWNL